MRRAISITLILLATAASAYVAYHSATCGAITTQQVFVSGKGDPASPPTCTSSLAPLSVIAAVGSLISAGGLWRVGRIVPAALGASALCMGIAFEYWPLRWSRLLLAVGLLLVLAACIAGPAARAADPRGAL